MLVHPERQQHHDSGGSHPPRKASRQTAKWSASLPPTSLIDNYGGTLHAALPSHSVSQRVPLLAPLLHWRVYHRLRLRDNGVPQALPESEGHDRRNDAPSVLAKQPLAPGHRAMSRGLL